MTEQFLLAAAIFASPVPAQVAPAPAAPPATADQIASIVAREFGTYDKDGDGELGQPEFAAWMIALRTRSDPAAGADAPATAKWVNAAFAQADKDRSRSLTQAELTGFLSQARS